MLQTKKPIHQFSSHSQFHSGQSPSNSFHFKRSNSQIISPFPVSLDLNVQQDESFICFSCGNGLHTQQCQQCSGKGFIEATHPLVSLMNDIFNTKLTSKQFSSNKKQLLSTKSSSNSNISENLSQSEILCTSLHKNPRSQKKKSPENPRNSILDFLLTPLQTIIKEESTVEQKCQKCNICHYEFDGIKYKCSECENYNVCESCYLTKRISHCHELKKMQSVTSQKNEKTEESDPPSMENQIISCSNNHEGEDHHEIENSHSDVDKLSFKSDESVELMFKGMDTKRELNLSKLKNNRSSFFQLHEIEVDSQTSQIKKGIKYCECCGHQIQNCYWLCPTCSDNGKDYQICKCCYDSNLYEHPKNHDLRLHFFHFDDNFLGPEHNFFDLEYIQEETNDLEETSQSKIQTDRSVSPLSLSNNIHSSEKQDSSILSIGVIGHRDIFTGFHKENENHRYPDEIISPIPKSIAMTHSFKEKRDSPELEGDLITELIKSSNSQSKAKNSLELQKVQVKAFNDQSRIEIDDNVIMDLGLSTDQNETSSQNLFSSERKCQQTPAQDLECKFKSVSEINPETSILEMNEEDFQFVDYYCDICAKNPIKNVKYHCLECESYDLCKDCYENRRLQHWHDHFRKDDGKMKMKKMAENKEKILKRAMESSMSRSSISPSRRSIRFLK